MTPSSGTSTVACQRCGDTRRARRAAASPSRPRRTRSATALGTIANYWQFTHDDQRQGLVVAIDDYAAFAKLVREELWNGL